jgi:uncharacterized protein (TIGR01777 family)
VKAEKIIIAGGSGFLGKALTKTFSQRGMEVVILSRRQAPVDSARTVQWDGRTIGDWAEEINGSSALINLTGRSVNCRYTERHRAEIMDSRILSTRVLGKAIEQCSSPPKTWLNSSTATIYKHSYDHPNDEETGMMDSSPAGRDRFSVEVAKAWEKELHFAHTLETHKVALRISIVLGLQKGGAWNIMQTLVQRGLGGHMGNGQQVISWIHIDDFCRAVEWILSNANPAKVYNLASPGPLPNRDFMTIFRKVSGRSFGLPAPRFLLEIGAFFMRTETELILKSRYVSPGHLLSEGFTFQYPDIESALTDLQSKKAV